MSALKWQIKPLDSQTLIATKKIAGNELSWVFQFDDETTFSQRGAGSAYSARLNKRAQDSDFSDLILPEQVLDTSEWKNRALPVVTRDYAKQSNRRYGSLRGFLNRFAGDVSRAYTERIPELLKSHFIKAPLRASFSDAPDAQQFCDDWLTRSGLRIMVVTGGAGAGKSVFALTLTRYLGARFAEDPDKYPAPLLVWFSNERPAVLGDLLTLTLNDLGLQGTLTPEAASYLLAQGRIVFILDGFDEVMRALAGNAEQNIVELQKSFNMSTAGRLILTSRPSFLDEEEIFSSLKSTCGIDQHETRTLAPYTDDQIHQWVILNAPNVPEAFPAERHWQRVERALNQSPEMRELCRTPAFLRMLSEILVKERSVKSRYRLVEAFCTEMWERERPKRTLQLSDEQYFLAYEAISKAATDQVRLGSDEKVKDWLRLYFAEYAPELLDSLPDDAESLVSDLAIGPLTRRGGVFSFEHDVLTGYFFARLLARSLTSTDINVVELWNRTIPLDAWQFLPEAANTLFVKDSDRAKLFAALVARHKHGLLLWNIARALKLKVAEIPKSLFVRKELASVQFDRADLRLMQFDSSTIHSATFDQCDFEGASFRNARLGKLKFVQCGTGAMFDNATVTEDTEITVVRAQNSPRETYAGEEAARRILNELHGAQPKPVDLPPNLAERAVVVVFSALFKVDERKFDYPESVKVVSRLRGWLRSFRLSEDRFERLNELLSELFSSLQDVGWISRNRNRSRTLVPAHERSEIVAQIVRTKRALGVDAGLSKLVAAFQEKIDSTMRS
jgi:hypothetical protein